MANAGTVLNNAADIRLGSTLVDAVYCGKDLIWQRKSPDPEPLFPFPESEYERYKIGRSAAGGFATHIPMTKGFKASVTCVLPENFGGSIVWFGYGESTVSGSYPFQITYDKRQGHVRCGKNVVEIQNANTYCLTRFDIEVNDKINVMITLLEWIGSFVYDPPLSYECSLDADFSNITDTSGNGFTIVSGYQVYEMKINGQEFIPAQDLKTRNYGFYYTGTGEFIEPGSGFYCQN